MSFEAFTGIRGSPASSNEVSWAAMLMSSSEPWVTLRRTEQKSLSILSDPIYRLFVSHDAEGTATGFILLHPEGVAGAPYVRSIAVDPRFRGLGIGTQLLTGAEEYFRPTAKHIFLCVSSFNPRARALYERLGYRGVVELADFAIAGFSELLMHKRIGA
jgi:[ribosomal protein S18]-alanine N-acetyltransferase